MEEAHVLKKNILELNEQAVDLMQCDMEKIWNLYHKSLEIRESFSISLNILEENDLILLSQTLTTAELSIYQELYQRLKQSPQEAKNWLAKRINELEIIFNEIDYNVQLDSHILVAQVQSYAVELLFLKKLAVYLEKNIDQNISPDIFSEVYAFISQSYRLKKIYFKCIKARVQNLSDQVLQEEVRVFQAETERLLAQDEISFEQIKKITRWGNVIPSNMSRRKKSHRVIFNNCRNARNNLKNYILQRIQASLPEDAESWTDHLITEMQERFDEAIVSIEEVSLAKTVKTLTTIKEDCKWLLKFLKENYKNNKNDKKLKKKYKKVKKLYRSVVTELQEQELQEKLESIFGKKFVFYFENFIIFLIFLVILLLFLDDTKYFSEYKFDLAPKYATDLNDADTAGMASKVEPLPKAIYKIFEKNQYVLSQDIVVLIHKYHQEWEIVDKKHGYSFLVIAKDHTLEVRLIGKIHTFFRWLDLIICFIFLMEIFTKLILVKGKLFYFYRHFLIDILPSIPVGFISTSLQRMEYAKFARLYRVIRLQRIVRYIRVIRPVIRIFRVITFLVRGIDRLVKRYARWLNRNIVFFGSFDEVQELQEPTFLQKIQELRTHYIFNNRRFYENLERPQPFMIAYIVSLEIRLQTPDEGIIIAESYSLKPDILIEDIMHLFLNLQGKQVEDILGRDFSYVIHQYMGYLDAPLIRRLPIVKRILALHKKHLAPDFTARIGRLFGRMLERILASIYWFCDLYGVVTASRLLDKIADKLILTFKHPTKRLFMFGGFFILANLLFSMLPFPFMKTILNYTTKIFGMPLIIMGCICLIPFLFGYWLRKVAGEASGFYEKIAEAQFINLLKTLKIEILEQDLQFIHDRVLQPEVRIRQQEDRNFPESITLMEQMRNNITNMQEEEESNETVTREEVSSERLYQQVLLLYKDYLDGAPLHKSDIKTTEQFLGNIIISNIRTHRLRYTKKQFKQLSRLDLTKNRSFFSPYLWFSFITQSICHNTAQLIFEYNKHAIRKSLLNMQTKENRAHYYKWLNKRSGKKRRASVEKIPSPELSKRKKLKLFKQTLFKWENTKPEYSTTYFNALHFLSYNPSQDEMIRFNFSEELYEIFCKDRENIIRTVFGTYPLRNLPKPQRSINMYQWYHEHLAGGRIFLFPFVLIWWACKAIWFSFKWCCVNINRLLKRDQYSEFEVSPKADFDVAIRKINRMRKPIYMACAKLRAQYDFEYLGLSLPWSEDLATDSIKETDEEKQHVALLMQDLEYIHALNHEYDYFRELISKRKKQLRKFIQFVEQQGWVENGFIEYLKKINPNINIQANSLVKELQHRHYQILRALAIAYTIDYRKLSSLLNAKETLMEVFDATLESKKLSLIQEIRIFFLRCKRRLSTWHNNWEYENFKKFWKDIEYDKKYNNKDKKRCWKAYIEKRTQLKEVLFIIKNEGDIVIIDEIIESIILNSSSWSDELLSLRTIQTLSVMDVKNYRQYIAQLGNY